MLRFFPQSLPFIKTTLYIIQGNEYNWIEQVTRGKVPSAESLCAGLLPRSTSFPQPTCSPRTGPSLRPPPHLNRRELLCLSKEPFSWTLHLVSQYLSHLSPSPLLFSTSPSYLPLRLRHLNLRYWRLLTKQSSSVPCIPRLLFTACPESMLSAFSFSPPRHFFSHTPHWISHQGHQQPPCCL